MRKSASFTLPEGIRNGLNTFAKSYCCSGCLHDRASIILKAEQGLTNREIGSMTGFHANTVRKSGRRMSLNGSSDLPQNRTYCSVYGSSSFLRTLGHISQRTIAIPYYRVFCCPVL